MSRVTDRYSPVAPKRYRRKKFIFPPLSYAHRKWIWRRSGPAEIPVEDETPVKSLPTPYDRPTPKVSFLEGVVAMLGRAFTFGLHRR